MKADRLREIAGFLRRVSSGYKVQTAQAIETLKDDAKECDRAADALETQAREIERLREALKDQIRATAYASGLRPDVIAMRERDGTLFDRHASPSARRALIPIDPPERVSEREDPFGLMVADMARRADILDGSLGEQEPERVSEASALREALEGMLKQFNEGMAGIVHDERTAIAKARRALEDTKGDA